MRTRSIIQLLAFAICSYWWQSSSAQATVISGELNGLRNGDTVILTRYNYGIDDPKLNETSFAVVRHGRFHFNLNRTTANTTISFLLPEKRSAGDQDLLALSRAVLRIAPNESLAVSQQGNRFFFRGKYANENQWLFKLAQFDLKYWAGNGQGPLREKTLAEEFAENNKWLAARLNYLNYHKAEIAGAVFSPLLARTWFGATAQQYFLFNLKKVTRQMEEPPITPVDYSEELAGYILEKFKYDSCTVKQQRFELGKCYRYIQYRYRGELRERLLTKLLLKQIKSDSLMKYAGMARTEFKNSGLRTTLDSLFSGFTVGGAAYDFSLPGEDGKTYRLSDFKGKIVVLDFWFTGCGACQDLSPKLAKIESGFNQDPIVFLSISIDKNKAQWRKSLLAGKYASGTSYKLYTGGKGEDHPLIRHYKVKAFPTLIVIDKNGNMMRSPVDPRLDEGQDMTALLKSAL